MKRRGRRRREEGKRGGGFADVGPFSVATAVRRWVPMRQGKGSTSNVAGGELHREEGLVNLLVAVTVAVAVAVAVAAAIAFHKDACLYVHSQY